MHFGHSHSHDHDHHTKKSTQILKNTTPVTKSIPATGQQTQPPSDNYFVTDGGGTMTMNPKMTPPVITGWRRRIMSLFQRPRFQISILFAIMVTLLPSLLLERRLQKADVVLFVGTAGALTLFNQVRNTFQVFSRKMKLFREGLMKHSPPQPMWTTKYFFKSENAADRVTFLGIIINIILSAGKAFIGVTCHSTALIADAGHSLSDLFSDFITLWAVQIARLPPDEDHPYGHGKFEAIGSLFLALTLLATGLGVGALTSENLVQIITAQRSSGIQAAALTLGNSVPTSPALVMAAVSIFSKEWLYRITRRVGDQLNSQVVIANAWHHRSDAYSSVLALLSIGLAMSFPGLIAADSAAGLLVAGIICLTGFEILGESVRQLTDTNDEVLSQQVKALALSESADVVQVRRLRTRQMGSSSIVDIDICAPASLSTSALKALEQRVRFKIMDGLPGIIDCEVHATSADSVVCPLLTATGLRSHESVSTHDVEDEANMLLKAHPLVESVTGCTVHYQNTILASVDATIRFRDSDKISIIEARNIAKELRDKLQQSKLIYKANIFLDLNENGSVRTTESNIAKIV